MTSTLENAGVSVQPEEKAAAPSTSRAEWVTSFDVADHQVPTGREEAWRFTPVRALKDLLTGTARDEHLTIKSSSPAEVTTAQITLAKAQELGAKAAADIVAAQAMAYAEHAQHINIPADAALTEAVIVDLNGTGQSVCGHLVVTAGHHSKATVVLRHTGSARYSQVLSVIAGSGAQLTVVSIQDWAADAVHLSQQDLVVGQDASVKHIVVSTGGSIVRVGSNVHYAGTGGNADLYGAYLSGPGQHLEHRSFVDHSTRNCTSDVLYKGALHGESARSVWIGDVLIRAEAAGTNTYELNRNLILTKGARADSVPNLEIETGDIEGAGHASTTGRFDDDQLFYLQSRGIPVEIARKIVVRGFFADIVHRIGVPEVHETLMDRIDAELDSTIGEGTA